MLDARAVKIPAERGELEGNLTVPPGAQGLVIFAHGSGSGRHSPRNTYVAGELQQAGIATLLMDLLTRQEEQIDAHTLEFRFDIDLLGRRLIQATDWAARDPAIGKLRLGYYGSSTGAAAAIVAAARRAEMVFAIVSRGGRPDLAGLALDEVCAPTLLIVGGADTPVVQVNRSAMAHMRGEVKMEIIPDATHLFEEPGALERVAVLAREWFEHFLVAAPIH